MSTVTLEISSLTDGLDAFRRAWTSGRDEDDARVGFASPELLWDVLTVNRWKLLQAMTGRGPMGIPEIARLLAERGGRAVQADVHALAAAGILRRNADGRFEFPYDTVHVDFMLRAA